MRILGLDFETTGLDPKVDRGIELGCALWDVELKRPIATVGVYLCDEGVKARMADPNVARMMIEKLGIKPEDVVEFGVPPKAQFEWTESFSAKHKIEYLVAHNAPYDRNILFAELDRHGIEAPTLRSLPWIDTQRDIPWKEEPDSKKLKYVASDHGFVNPFSHRAVFDVLTMLRVLSLYDIKAVITQGSTPDIVIRAVVPHPKNDGGVGKDKAKAVGFRWQEIDGKSFPMMWVKKIKEDQLEVEKKKLDGYEVIRIL